VVAELIDGSGEQQEQHNNTTTQQQQQQQKTLLLQLLFSFQCTTLGLPNKSGLSNYRWKNDNQPTFYHRN
jgi:hypothetical protein